MTIDHYSYYNYDSFDLKVCGLFEEDEIDFLVRLNFQLDKNQVR